VAARANADVALPALDHRHPYVSERFAHDRPEDLGGARANIGGCRPPVQFIDEAHARHPHRQRIATACTKHFSTRALTECDYAVMP